MSWYVADHTTGAVHEVERAEDGTLVIAPGVEIKVRERGRVIEREVDGELRRWTVTHRHETAYSHWFRHPITPRVGNLADLTAEQHELFVTFFDHPENRRARVSTDPNSIWHRWIALVYHGLMTGPGQDIETSEYTPRGKYLLEQASQAARARIAHIHTQGELAVLTQREQDYKAAEPQIYALITAVRDHMNEHALPTWTVARAARLAPDALQNWLDGNELPPTNACVRLAEWLVEPGKGFTTTYTQAEVVYFGLATLGHAQRTRILAGACQVGSDKLCVPPIQPRSSAPVEIENGVLRCIALQRPEEADRIRPGVRAQLQTAGLILDDELTLAGWERALLPREKYELERQSEPFLVVLHHRDFAAGEVPYVNVAALLHMELAIRYGRRLENWWEFNERGKLLQYARTRIRTYRDAQTSDTAPPHAWNARTLPQIVYLRAFQAAQLDPDDGAAQQAVLAAWRRLSPHARKSVPAIHTIVPKASA